jgi:hypothetical protein
MPQLKNLTAQQIFDDVCLGLIEQNHKATNPQGQCVYRTTKKRGCAVGLLLTEEEATPAVLVGGSVWTLADAGLLPTRLHPFKELLSDLQSAHDTAQADSNDRFQLPHELPGWVGYDCLGYKLAKIAAIHKLDKTILHAAFPYIKKEPVA